MSAFTSAFCVGDKNLEVSDFRGLDWSEAPKQLAGLRWRIVFPK